MHYCCCDDMLCLNCSNTCAFHWCRWLHHAQLSMETQGLLIDGRGAEGSHMLRTIAMGRGKSKGLHNSVAADAVAKRIVAKLEYN